MLKPDSFPKDPQGRVAKASVWAVIRLAGGATLIAVALTLAVLNKSGLKTREAPSGKTPSPAPQSTIRAPSSPLGATGPHPIASPLGLTLEEFQTRYESLSGKMREQEMFFLDSLGKEIIWTVRVDHVFTVENGVIVVFSSIERPDWAAFPISDARFPVQLKSRLMALSRGDVIKIKGKIVDQGIKTLDCSDFEMATGNTPQPAP